MPKEQSKTKSFVLRIDAETMEALEKWAADEFRSINGQIQWLIDDALRRSGLPPPKKHAWCYEKGPALEGSALISFTVRRDYLRSPSLLSSITRPASPAR